MLATRLSTRDADSSIADMIGWFGERQLPAIWYVSAEDRPADLPKRLTRAGAQSERTSVVMGAATARVAEGNQHARLYASLPLGAGSPWRHWLAYEHGQPVGMVSGAFTGRAVLLEHLGVVPGVPAARPRRGARHRPGPGRPDGRATVGGPRTHPAERPAIPPAGLHDPTVPTRPAVLPALASPTSTEAGDY